MSGLNAPSTLIVSGVQQAFSLVSVGRGRETERERLSVWPDYYFRSRYSLFTDTDIVLK